MPIKPEKPYSRRETCPSQTKHMPAGRQEVTAMLGTMETLATKLVQRNKHSVNRAQSKLRRSRAEGKQHSFVSYHM